MRCVNLKFWVVHVSGLTFQIYTLQGSSKRLLFFRRVGVKFISNSIVLKNYLFNQWQQIVDICFGGVQLYPWNRSSHDLIEGLCYPFDVLKNIIKKKIIIPHPLWQRDVTILGQTLREGLAFITVSGVISLWLLCGGWFGATRPVLPCFLGSIFDCCFEDDSDFCSLGRAFLKILTMRRLIGNMIMELWMPIMTCCQVNSIWPAAHARMKITLLLM